MTIMSIFPKNHDRNLQNFCRNVHNVVTVKLVNDNFDLWRKQITLSLTAYKLLKFVDGRCPKPAATTVEASPPPSPASDVESIEDAATDVEVWEQTDALILSNILSTISPQLLLKLSHHTTSSSLWSDLLQTYTTLSVAHIHQLKSELCDLEKLGSMEEYLDKIKAISDRLALAGAPMTDIDLVHQAVLRLPTEYDAITTIVRTTTPPVSFARLYAMLLDEELVVKKRDQRTGDVQSKALMAQSTATQDSPAAFDQRHVQPTAGAGRAQNQNSKLFRKSGRGKQFGKGQTGQYGRGQTGQPSASNPQGVTCQICGMSNHSAAKCYQRYNRDAPTAYVASSSSPGQSQQWYFDSGASNHLTNQLGNLTVSNQRVGQDGVMVGNGSFLPVHHTGDGLLSTPSNDFFSY